MGLICIIIVGISPRQEAKQRKWLEAAASTEAMRLRHGTAMFANLDEVPDVQVDEAAEKIHQVEFVLPTNFL